MARTYDSAHWDILRVPPTPAEALVLLLVNDGAGEPAAFADRWATSVPRSAFAALRVAGSKPVADDLAEAIRSGADSLGIGTAQIILVARGMLGHSALDLVAFGRVPGTSAIVIDIPPGDIPAGPLDMQGSLRFVQHRREDDPEGRQFDALVHALSQTSLDIRTFALWDGPDPTDRALGTFLGELVAHAGRYRSARRPVLSLRGKPA